MLRPLVRPDLRGELIRDGYDQTLTVDGENLRFVFQGMWDKDKGGKAYGQFQWRIGMLTPAKIEARSDEKGFSLES